METRSQAWRAIQDILGPASFIGICTSHKPLCRSRRRRSPSKSGDRKKRARLRKIVTEGSLTQYFPWLLSFFLPPLFSSLSHLQAMSPPICRLDVESFKDPPRPYPSPSELPTGVPPLRQDGAQGRSEPKAGGDSDGASTPIRAPPIRRPPLPWGSQGKSGGKGKSKGRNFQISKVRSCPGRESESEMIVGTKRDSASRGVIVGVRGKTKTSEERSFGVGSFGVGFSRGWFLNEFFHPHCKSH